MLISRSNHDTWMQFGPPKARDNDLQNQRIRLYIIHGVDFDPWRQPSPAKNPANKALINLQPKVSYSTMNPAPDASQAIRSSILGDQRSGPVLNFILAIISSGEAACPMATHHGPCAHHWQSLLYSPGNQPHCPWPSLEATEHKPVPMTKQRT